MTGMTGMNLQIMFLIIDILRLASTIRNTLA